MGRARRIRAAAVGLLITLLLFGALPTIASAQTYTDLFNFGGIYGREPGWPNILAQGRDGNLYGTVPSGGTNGRGVVFKITSSGTLTVLNNFGTDTDGNAPEGGLTLGVNGNFYGTTVAGGDPSCNCGTVFAITPAGTLTTLYTFTGGLDGAYPGTTPIVGADGNLYGATAQAGANGVGTIYKLTPTGVFTLVGPFPSYGAPSPLMQGIDGDFYGTDNQGVVVGGTVFKVTPKGTLTSLYEFGTATGACPFGGLIQDSNGNIYGTADYGGAYGSGVVFKLTPQGVITVLHSFGDPNYPNDGVGSFAGLIQDSVGNLYGVSQYGGLAGYGAIFQLTSAGTYSILYNFEGVHGKTPVSTPMQHTNGKIYGMTIEGGTSQWTRNEGVLYSFDLGLTPFITFVAGTGRAGKTIEILGQGFTGATGVSFNSVPATFKVFSDTYLTAIAPPGVTTGSVTVTTSTGTLTSNKPFRVLPTFLTFNPTNGAVGTAVVITGTGLTQTNHVSFGGIAATFTVDSDAQVTATVPAGAQTGGIQIGTLGGFAASSGVFTVTQ
jgi:uncharacterized repeat protein (TIGR03803 family)